MLASRNPLLWLATLATGCASHAAVRAEIDIAAPPEVVWSVLTDLSSYPAWNSFTPRVDGTLALGKDVTLHVQLQPGRAQRLQHQHITKLDAPHVLGWETKLLTRSILRAERTQTLTPLPDGKTHYVTEDSFHGGFVPLVMRMYRKTLEQRFAEMAHALKARAEQLSASMPATPLARR